MPPHPKQTAARKTGSSLGRLVARHHRFRLSWLRFGAFTLVGITIVLGPLFWGLYRYYIGYTQHGPVAAITWSRPWYLIASLGLLVFGILVLDVFRKSRQYIAVHHYGLRVKTNKANLIPWEQIEGISFTVIQTRILKFTLTARPRAYLILVDGAHLQLDHQVEMFSDLLARLKTILYPRLLAKLQERYRIGEWVEFGPITVNTGRLRLNGREQPWTDVHRLLVQSGFLVVELANQVPIKIPVIQIPNLEIMLQVIMVGEKT